MQTPLYRRLGSALIVFPGVFVIPLAIGWVLSEMFDSRTLVAAGYYPVGYLTFGIAFGGMLGWFFGRAALETRNAADA